MNGTWADRVEALVAHSPGLTDREIADRLSGPGQPQQAANQAARMLAARGRSVRRQRPDGRIGNFPNEGAPAAVQPPRATGAPAGVAADGQTEDQIKQHLGDYLTERGWQPRIAWGRQPGVDIDARRGPDRWLIEVKGSGSRSAMRVNYFVGMLGELLQRMDDPDARYSVAMPDLQQFRRLWERLPALARQRAQISALFVREDGSVIELD